MKPHAHRGAKPATTLLLALLTATSAALAGPSGAHAQTLAGPESSVLLVPPHPEAVDPEAPPRNDRRSEARSDTHLAGTTVAASLGSVAGLYGGALAGFALAGGEPYGTFYVSMGLGTVIGAGLLGGAASGDWDRAFLGSVLGAGLGLAVVSALQPESDTGLLLSYGLVHGVTTALISGR